MTNDKPGYHLYTRIFSRRRLVLLTSVAGIAAIVALGGPAAYNHLDTHISTPLISSARAADTRGPQSAGFADLVARVKPAVISVRVQFDEASAASELSSNDQEIHRQVPRLRSSFNNTVLTKTCPSAMR